ncbi:hypothetical protein ACSSNL_13280 [Thalassobius sp. S69A]|uniref:hypothetical protein n=1 Tax=unclassified Thalassovita TaxID=2619711 RepID=UPI003C79FCB6
MNWAPIARIVLRYIAGGVVFGSVAIGDRLAADPDIVMVTGALIGAMVEGAYYLAKRRGWRT